MADDFIDAPHKRKASDAARERARAAPRPRRASNGSAVGGHARAALESETRAVATASKGTRNDTLNTACFNLGQLVGAGSLDYDDCVRELRSAALASGLTEKELRQWRLPERGLDDGMTKPRDLSDVGTRTTTTVAKANGHDHGDEFAERTLSLRKLSTVRTRVPMWVWEHGGAGRLQLGTLAMFAGRPAAGKSTAARWFAARISRGELEGVWEGHPMRVALLMTEEQTDAMVVPGLIAAGADLENVFQPDVRLGEHEGSLMSVRDEHALTEELCDNGIRALFIDPVMSTFDQHVDPNSNSSVRQYLSPYMRIAEKINGVVVCVSHLRKGQVKDVMEAITGSSAFGELPRCVFGFAPVDGGMHLMQQVKNSAGVNGLKLAYHLPIEQIETDDGQVTELPRFEITGETELSISDIGGDHEDQDSTTASADVEWLREYLRREQPAPSARVKQDARQHADISESRLHRARKRLRVRIINNPTPNAPHQTAWCLPEGS